jgi:hypothetical protein
MVLDVDRGFTVAIAQRPFHSAVENMIDKITGKQQ